MSEVTRRRVLAASGAVATGAIAGCTSSAEEDDGEADEPDPEGTVLGDVAVENLSAADHEVDVLVEFDGDLEHWSSHDLGAGEGVTVERDWSADPSEFRVRARLDGQNLTESTPATWNEPDCLNLLIAVNRSGDLEILSTPEGGPCAAEDGFDEDD